MSQRINWGIKSNTRTYPDEGANGAYSTLHSETTTKTLGYKQTSDTDDKKKMSELLQKIQNKMATEFMSLQSNMRRLSMFVSLLVIVSLGLVGGLAWTCVTLEEQSNELKLLREAVENLQATAEQTNAQSESGGNGTGTNTSTERISTNTVTSSTTSTPSTTVASTTTTVTYTTQQILNNTNLEVLQTKEDVIYKNHSFFAVQIRVPSDGLSKSENWCREYQYLCEHFSRRPTGCTIDASSPHILNYEECRDEYNADLDIDDVLNCNPSFAIAEIANDAFQNLSTPARNGYNAFGFHRCNDAYCQKTIEGSDTSMSFMRSLAEANDTIMYTVCR